ncbi:hypothetical protein Drorol1_Dr00010110 [Drosera rotundifolia]
MINLQSVFGRWSKRRNGKSSIESIRKPHYKTSTVGLRHKGSLLTPLRFSIAFLASSTIEKSVTVTYRSFVTTFSGCSIRARGGVGYIKCFEHEWDPWGHVNLRAKPKGAPDSAAQLFFDEFHIQTDPVVTKCCILNQKTALRDLVAAAVASLHVLMALCTCEYSLIHPPSRFTASVGIGFKRVRQNT